MPLTLRRGIVTAIVERAEGLVRLEVDGVACVAYPQLTGPVALGDDVLVNTQARDLELGSGGFDILHANLTRGLDLEPERGAHVMKLPYTSLQFAVLHGEERATMPQRVDGMPVVACSLHSHVAPACAALRGLRVAYVQVPGGALPVALSDALRALKSRGLIEITVAAGPCFGSDVECVGIHSALLLAHARGVDVAVCAIGPGVVGTGTLYGHGGMSAREAAVATHELGGRAVLVARVSGLDSRERHRGVSHHTDAILSLTDGPVDVAWPAGAPFEPPSDSRVQEVAVDEWRDACSGLPLEHMGRGAEDDPWFFAAAFAAGKRARMLVR